MDAESILKKLEKSGSSKNRKGMKRFGIKVENAYGVSLPAIRGIAKELKKEGREGSLDLHDLALQLWKTKNHEGRMLACFIADTEKTDEKLMEKWVQDFDSWDITDQCCSNLFDKTPLAYKKAVEWSKRKEEFVKRAGFVLMAALSVHDKKADDKKFLKFVPYIKKECTDERNFVKKAVNWAIRQIGKRNLHLNRELVKVAREILAKDSKTAKWIAKDAIKELESEKVKKRLKEKEKLKNK